MRTTVHALLILVAILALGACGRSKPKPPAPEYVDLSWVDANLAAIEKKLTAARASAAEFGGGKINGTTYGTHPAELYWGNYREVFETYKGAAASGARKLTPEQARAVAIVNFKFTQDVLRRDKDAGVEAPAEDGTEEGDGEADAAE